jgi:hypothetical protein
VMLLSGFQEPVWTCQCLKNVDYMFCCLPVSGL